MDWSNPAPKPVNKTKVGYFTKHDSFDRSCWNLFHVVFVTYVQRKGKIQTPIFHLRSLLKCNFWCKFVVYFLLSIY